MSVEGVQNGEAGKVGVRRRDKKQMGEGGGMGPYHRVIQWIYDCGPVES